MKPVVAFAPLFLLLPSCSTLSATAAPPVPQVDYHQHLVSPAFAPLAKLPARDGPALVRMLDAAGVKQAVVLSVGYSFADERKKLSDPDRLTRVENDWTSAQVAASKSRLIGFCSANPLRPEALRELERCLALPGMIGIKQHMGNAGVSLRDPQHLRRMREVFALAQRKNVPVLIHMRSRGGDDYGAQDAHIFLDAIVPVAPDIEIVVAHLGSSGPGYVDQHEEVMAVFGGAAERRDPRMRNLYFDISSNVVEDPRPDRPIAFAKRVRQVGTHRILYGSDLVPPGGGIRQSWELFRTKIPLTPAEFRQIARNRPRFMR